MALVDSNLVELVEDAIKNVVSKQCEAQYACTCIMTILYKEGSHVDPEDDHEGTLECEECCDWSCVL